MTQMPKKIIVKIAHSAEKPAAAVALSVEL
jgi:hypothetical protein